MTHFSLTSVRAVLVVYSVVAGWSMGGVAADNHDHNNTSGTVIGFRNETLTSVLPESLSDMTAVLDATNAKVYIHGGCNAPLGNVYNAEFEFYGCDSLSNATHVFDLETRTFDDVPASMTMPVARYRHAAVLVQGQIWIVGGRNLTDDALVETIDVFTIATGTWTTYDDIDPQYILSDLAGFAGPDGFPYFAGGYSANYTAQTTVFAIHMDTTTNASSPILKIVDHAPLPTARGDVSGVAVQEEGSDEWFALVTGGFTHVDDWCNPLETSERYDFSTQTWTATAALAIPRGDKALVVLETRDRVYALGGESKLPESCDNSVNASLPVNDVEWYNDAENKWSIVADLPRHRFRFAAVGYLFSIYSFGGQLALDPDCNCFKTSNEVVVYTEIFDKNSNGTGTNSGAGGKLFQLGFYLAILVAIVGAI